MTATAPDGGPGRPAEVARLGIFRPPLVYLAGILAGWALHATWPLPLVGGAVARGLGVALVVVSVALFIWSATTFRAAGTPVPARKPTTAIVRAGPYRVSRNPIYLAFTLFQLGIALWASSLWLVVTLIGAVAIIHLVVIPREERYLERRFGAEYQTYKASVRRWL